MLKFLKTGFGVLGLFLLVTLLSLTTTATAFEVKKDQTHITKVSDVSAAADFAFQLGKLYNLDAILTKVAEVPEPTITRIQLENDAKPDNTEINGILQEKSRKSNRQVNE